MQSEDSGGYNYKIWNPAIVIEDRTTLFYVDVNILTLQSKHNLAAPSGR
jgi:hypothetical protein